MSEAVYRMRLSFEGQRFALTDLSQADLRGVILGPTVDSLARGHRAKGIPARRHEVPKTSALAYTVFAERMPNVPPENPYSATGSVLGYLYQVRLALLLFLQRFRGDRQTDISIERYDDIAFEKQGSAVDLLQTKHHINAAGNLSDSSEDLWRTLRVWCSMVGSGWIQLPGTNFILITTACAPQGVE